jgi:chitinase
MNYLFLSLGALTVITQGVAAHASPPHSIQSTSIAQPTTCIDSQFSATGDEYWKSMTIKLTNNCGKAVDFQNATLTFKSQTAVSTTFWGDFSPLSYPDNALNISSQAQTDGTFLATLNLHFPSYPGANSKLPAGSSFKIEYGVSSDDHLSGSLNVYLGTSVATGTITLINTSNRPINVAQNYALVHLTMNGQPVNDVQIPWKGTIILTGLATGNYNVMPENISDGNGNSYQGSAAPSVIALSANQTVTSNLAYTMVNPTGNISINLQALPGALSGYTNNPTVLVSQSPSGSSLSKSLTWNTSTTISNLVNGSTYSFSTPLISYNGYNCTPTFNPATLVANATSTPTTNLTYQCVQIQQDSVTLDVQGAPSTLTSLNVTLTPNDNSAPITQTINLTNGAGSSIISLTDGVIYTVKADAVAGYSVSFSPQPLTATANAVETIIFSQIPQSSGRIIGYVPGWKTPPSAQSLANAGYTHVLIAFGVFSTTSPGVVTPAFDTITAAYIQSLHQAGIKVLLSLGGALTSIPNTTVDFHQVLTAASSPAAFQQTFINSLQGLITQYGFDGFDIDIESGLTAGGTFAQPQGDITVLASIINTMYSQNPSLLITMAPQVANVAATSGFDQTWGNYASLIMQTHNSLAWVGIQLYNTGCAFGIDQICYGPTPTTTPDFTVAMATDLLADWPATVNGRATGFQPYISYLNPSQVVIGYPSPNANGASDGSPVTPTTTIIRALQCLKTAVAGANSCDTYIPPKAYGAIGGVFNWEVTYDQNNNFKFATDLKNCVINGICN